MGLIADGYAKTATAVRATDTRNSANHVSANLTFQMEAYLVYDPFLFRGKTVQWAASIEIAIPRRFRYARI